VTLNSIYLKENLEMINMTEAIKKKRGRPVGWRKKKPIEDEDDNQNNNYDSTLGV
jgi:hypothetical protein